MSDLRKVYFDFQDGNGFIDVSSIVKYDTFTIDISAFNDTYHYSQNTCSFDTIYNNTITPLILSTDKNIIVRILDWSDETVLSTEQDWLLTTENAFYLVAEQGIANPIFYGQIKPTRSRSYNGILDNTILTLDATDELDLLDKDVGDIVLSNCAILDPANPSNSIVHILAAIAGFTNISPTITILDTIQKFSPEKETESILDILDTLLYEYGYVININASGMIEPIKWINDSVPSTTPIFNNDNIITSISIKDTLQNYDGAKTIYYEIGSMKKVLLYRDDKCEYNDNGTFAGYNIIAGSSYPPETNVIDETTGSPTVVYQEYTDDSIKYWTNKAIKNKLDYNYKAFDSDFSAIIATENHFTDVKYSVGIIATAPVFYNKKCRLLYNNPTTDSTLKLYYNNVYGDVWYKSAERTSTVDNVTEPANRYEYTAKYIFTKEKADALTKTYAAQYSGHRVAYGFISEEFVSTGSLAYVQLDEGTNQLCIVQKRSWDEKAEYYNYTLISCSVSKPALTAQTIRTAASVDPTYTYASITSIGTPVAAGNSAPAYRGIGILSSADNAAFAGATVNESGVITTTSTVNANIGDWMINYASTYLSIGMYVWDGSTASWKTTSDVDYVSSASIDLCNLQVGGITVSGFTTFITAIVKTLFAQNINIMDPGYIKSINYSSGAAGFKISSNGNAEFNDINVNTATIDGTYWGLPTRVGSPLSIGLDSTDSYTCRMETAAMAVVRCAGASNTNRLVKVIWNGDTFVTVGSWLTTLDVIYSCISIVDNAVYAISEIYENGGYLSGFRLANYRFNTSTLTWSRISYSGISISGSVVGVLSSDNTYIYVWYYSTTEDALCCNIIDPTTYTLIASSTLAKMGKYGINLSAQYVKDGNFLVTYSADSSTQDSRVTALLHIDPTTHGISILSSYTFPQFGQNPVARPGIVMFNLTDFAVITVRNASSYSTTSIRDVWVFKIIDGTVTLIHKMALAASSGSFLMGTTAFIGSYMSITDPSSSTITMYSLGFSLGRPDKLVK